MGSRLMAAAMLGSASIFSAGLVFAGSLAPPAGPVAATFKTLSDVEPRIPVNAQTAPGNASATHVISAPGSYYLVRALTGQAGRSGVLITASDVTLDLNGFALDGAGAGDTGVTANSGLRNVTVRNGVVRDWTSNGVDIQGSESSRIERIAASSNGGWGIRGGTNGLIIDCVAQNNGSHGIVVFDRSAVSGSSALGNAFDGFITGAGARVTDCEAFTNGGAGINLQQTGTLSGSTARANSGSGFVVGAGGIASNCVSSDNSLDGFQLGTGASVVQCAAYSNDRVGFSMGSGSHVIDCNASSNGSHGVSAGANALVRGGIMYGNGTLLANGSGVLVSDADSRIEGVHAIDNDSGVRATVAGSVVIGCSASGNALMNIDVALGINGPTLIVDPTDQALGNFDF